MSNYRYKPCGAEACCFCDDSERHVKFQERIHTLQAENEALRERVRELEEANRWIPVSDHLPPEHNVTVLVAEESGARFVDFGYITIEGEWITDSKLFDNQTKFWMPLPTPPQPKPDEVTLDKVTKEEANAD